MQFPQIVVDILNLRRIEGIELPGQGRKNRDIVCHHIAGCHGVPDLDSLIQLVDIGIRNRNTEFLDEPDAYQVLQPCPGLPADGGE
ncbi:hypothetical protein [Nocardia canadensis]|uniref:hypothetical protein n=1 Tax=Nocardia canadensis TaxID=3065238 RepID=UPI00292F1420|nr:hypothetical protein [Nocardia canadensis]